METDASDYALAAILSIITKDNEIHPIAFHSRTFSAPELNYDVHDKELLAIFEAFKIWQHYLEGSASPIDVVTVMEIKRFDHETKVKVRSERQNLQTASQLCTKQVGTGEINQIIQSLLKVKVQRITKTYQIET